MKKVLIVNTVLFTKGGMSSVIMNYYQNMDRITFYMDFVANKEIDGDYERCMTGNGSQIYVLQRNSHPIKYILSLYCILKRKNYDVIHIHGNSATMLIDILPALMAGVKNRIVHCHNTKCDYPRLSKLLNIFFRKSYTKALACSKAAGDWIFGEGNFEVLPNGIDIKKYRFSEEIRNRVRDDLNIPDKFVIGHVGYINRQKNHEKLLSVFYELKKVKKNAHLLCIAGDLEVPEHLRKLMMDYGIENDVTILFQRSDVNELLQVMDVFVFPSRWEGFGLALLEAQAAGLPCVVSDRCIPEINMVEQMRYVPLEASDKEWAENINTIYSVKTDRIQCNEILHAGKYNMKNCVHMLEQIYAGKRG